MNINNNFSFNLTREEVNEALIKYIHEESGYFIEPGVTFVTTFYDDYPEDKVDISHVNVEVSKKIDKKKK